MLPPRAYFFIGLNGVRILSIIAMLLVFASGIFVLVSDIQAVNRSMKAPDTDMTDCDYIEGSTVPNQPAGVFWAVVNRLFIIFQVVVLILSEIGWPAAFFDRFFPVLGPTFGLGALGIFQCLIGATVLSHHVDDFTLVAAFFLFALGCLNMLLGLVFREKAKEKRSIMSWRAEAKGVLPSHRDMRPTFARPASASFVNSMFKGGNDRAQPEEFGQKGHGFGRQGEKAAGLKGFLISKPLESLPRYAPPPPRSDSSRAGTPEPTFKSSATAI
ncbi:uncharacterized protein TRAVEDRAFT_61490 [Trametes versicolor FP-101664 SS1]|uniref:DUF7598 domain-containing protein n=1 Tax=Trametes versicolor (strain FP-101664) TaxID=717944 RepID=R7S805_TRAVS|nr:uncharacterized protein TRAVEDRAFT_61490 [Trametes versicolor FP-101664 SS1]EIW51797.1 hypothetical protein TRAVEDRAFT_61490 [Trametes versicolor FP-101664 SS1]